MTLKNAEALQLDMGNAKWCELATLIHFGHFKVLNSHSLRGIIYFHKIKNEVRTIFKDLEKLCYPLKYDI